MQASDTTSRKTVLIVDDESGIVEVLELILADAGYRVLSALNGQEALTRMEQITPDAVIMDFMMPIMDGAQLLQRMIKHDGYKAIPVIMTSAMPEESVKMRCSGYQVFLRKPFKSDKLLDALGQLLSPETSSSCPSE
jgi:CheY-like chemotaxis protein